MPCLSDLSLSSPANSLAPPIHPPRFLLRTSCRHPAVWSPFFFREKPSRARPRGRADGAGRPFIVDFERKNCDRHASMHFVVPLRSSVVPSTFISCRTARQPHDSCYRYSGLPPTVQSSGLVAYVLDTVSRPLQLRGIRGSSLVTYSVSSGSACGGAVSHFPPDFLRTQP